MSLLVPDSCPVCNRDVSDLGGMKSDVSDHITNPRREAIVLHAQSTIIKHVFNLLVSRFAIIATHSTSFVIHACQAGQRSTMLRSHESGCGAVMFHDVIVINASPLNHWGRANSWSSASQ